MSPRFHREWRPLAKQLKRLGYDIVPGGKHHKIIAPDGSVVANFASTPSDFRAIKNKRAELRRQGIPV